LLALFAPRPRLRPLRIVPRPLLAETAPPFARKNKADKTLLFMSVAAKIKRLYLAAQRQTPENLKTA
jgi:hypothetical protein